MLRDSSTAYSRDDDGDLGALPRDARPHRAERAPDERRWSCAGR